MADAQTPSEPERSKTPDQSAPLDGNDLETPKNSRQVKEFWSRVVAADGVSETVIQRRGLRKLQQGFDELTARVASNEHEIEQLKSALERQRPRKQRRVLPRSQQAFVDLQDVEEARDQLRDEADRIRPRRSARYGAEPGSEVSETGNNWDEEIEEVLDEIQVSF